jgi:pyruvate kinase
LFHFQLQEQLHSNFAAMQAGWGQAQIKPMESLDMSKYCKLEEVEESINRKCKIVCTMGPNQSSKEAIISLINAGMNVARMNFSHGDHETHGAMVSRIREACKECGKSVAIALDTKGPEIRTGFFKEGGKISLTKGQDLKLVTDYSFKGDNTCFALSYPMLCKSVKPGNIILCADGSLSLKVKEVGTDSVMTEVMNDCMLGERKNCNLPGIQVELPVLQEKDINDLVNFGIPHGVDMVFASFVQSAADVDFIRKTLGVRGRQIQIIPKIENEAGVANFDEIVACSDGIMVARGDLGMEIPPENVFVAQKMMITKCNLAGKPVITATQMLESMCGAPRPTRAEASDVANAVLDGTDCVMLSGETAAGGYPLEAVTIMRKICQTTEEILDYSSIYLNTRMQVLAKGSMSAVEGVCSSAVKAAIDCDAKLIVALTETGATAVQLAKYRPKAQILAITASETTERHLKICRGVVPMLTASFVGTDSVIAKALKQAKEWGMVKTGDAVVAVHGTKEECPGSSTLMKMITVA